MNKQRWLGYIVRVGILVAVAALLVRLVRGWGSTAENTGPPSGLQWLQRQPLVERPTPRALPRLPFLPQRRPTSTPPAPVAEGAQYPVLTEALATTGVGEYHQSGYRGQGTTVAVVDTQFDGLETAVDAGELPTSLRAWRLTEDEELVSELRDGAGPHGTACAEIVHDLAPAASLVLVQVDDFLQTAASLFEYLELNGVHIVSLSISVLEMGRADGTGTLGDPPVPIYDVLRTAVERRGMLVVISAGNYARQHYLGDFQDLDSDGLHEFGCGATGFCDEAAGFLARKGEAFTVQLSWNDWGSDPAYPRPKSDYDLTVLGPDLLPVGTSMITQTAGIPPVEQVRVLPDEDARYSVQVRRRQPTVESHELRLWLAGSTVPLLRYQVPYGSLGPPADAQDVLTIGAANVATGLRLSTSSQGPTADGRIQPDLTGYANVSVSDPAYGPYGFTGTSAATPHVAGMAAVLLSRAGLDTPPQAVAGILRGAAADQGARDADNLWGHGLAALPPLERIATLVEPSLDGAVLMGPLGRFTVLADVRRGDDTHIPHLARDAFRVRLAGVRCATVAAADLGDRYWLTLQWPDDRPHPDARGRGIPLTVDIQPDGGSPGAAAAITLAVRVEADTQGHQLDLVAHSSAGAIGAPIPLYAVSSAATREPVRRIVVEVKTPLGQADAIVLLDDGQSGDGTASDGTYGGRYPATQVPGAYRFVARADGPDGAPWDSADLIVEVLAGVQDADGDGLPETWERTYGLNPSRDDRFRDPDADGLNNADEYAAGSNPQDWDTDRDGLSDHAEITGYYLTKPYSADSDLGGVSDADEIAQRTNPLDPADDERMRDRAYLPVRLRHPAPRPPAGLAR